MLSSREEPSIEVQVHGKRPNHPPIGPSPFRFPEGHRQWGKVDDISAIVSLGPEAYHTVMQHVGSDLSREVGGILLGRVFEDTGLKRYIIAVDQALPDLNGLKGPATFSFTYEGWTQLANIAESRFPDLRIVGWYHSHPRFGVFYSNVDQESHRTYFNKPWLVGLVVDPVNNQAGFFTVDAKQPLAGFYERLEERGRFIKWETGFLPNRASQAVRQAPADEQSQELLDNWSSLMLDTSPRSIPRVYRLAVLGALLLSLFGFFAIAYQLSRYSQLNERLRALESTRSNASDIAIPEDNSAIPSLAPQSTVQALPQNSAPDSILPSATDTNPLLLEQLTTPPSATFNPIVHTVKDGETLNLVAEKYDVTVAAIIKANPQLRYQISLIPGMRLTIPDAESHE